MVGDENGQRSTIRKNTHSVHRADDDIDLEVL